MDKVKGLTFGNLTITSEPYYNTINNAKRLVVRVKCSCGSNEKEVRLDAVIGGKTKSCGCSRKISTAKDLEKRHQKRKEQYKGSKYQTKQGYEITIIEYINANEVLISFACGYSVKTNIYSIKNGTVEYPFHKTVYGVGFLGVGKYNIKDYKDIYNTWIGMLTRCYSNDERYTAYKNVTCCDEWFNFQNFAEWFLNNKPYHTKEKLYLDKDILSNGDKIYSPDTCLLVPREINNAFIINKGKKDLPVGVTKNNNHYIAKVRKHGKAIILGKFDTISEARKAYVKEKELYIKELADTYKDAIVAKAYYALKNYKIGDE